MWSLWRARAHRYVCKIAGFLAKRYAAWPMCVAVGVCAYLLFLDYRWPWGILYERGVEGWVMGKIYDWYTEHGLSKCVAISAHSVWGYKCRDAVRLTIRLALLCASVAAGLLSSRSVLGCKGGFQSSLRSLFILTTLTAVLCWRWTPFFHYREPHLATWTSALVLCLVAFGTGALLGLDGKGLGRRHARGLPATPRICGTPKTVG